MKTKTLISLTLLVLVCGFVFIRPTAENTNISPPLSPPEGFKDKFYIGIMDIGNVTSGYSSQYDNMDLNLWHKYPMHSTGIDNGWTNWVAGDVLTASYSQYGDQIKSQVLAWAHGKNMRVLMDRVKLDYLCYGQRSDYQCESEDCYRQNHPYPDRWFYTYNNHPPDVSTDYTDNDPVYGSGEQVRYSSTSLHTAGYVVYGLKSNREQINCDGFSHPYMKDNIHAWYVKPRIRADKNYIDNHNDEPICRIEVYNFDDTLIKSTIIRARNLKDGTGYYDGKYHEEFNFNPQLNDSTLFFPDWQASNFNPNCEFILEQNCQVDYKVYWYGNCDMWIDYVRVDNDVANDLFGSGIQHDIYMDWLQWEVQDIACSDPYNATLKFYIEEFEFNNLPCMAYVARKIREISQSEGKNYSLMCDLSYIEGLLLQVPSYEEHSSEFDAEYIQRNIVDSLGLEEIFTFAYPFNGYSYQDPPPGQTETFYGVPQSLPQPDHNINYGRLGLPELPDAYDFHLQEWLDNPGYDTYDDRFIFKIKLSDAISKLCGIPFVNLVQTHMTYNGEGGYTLREPTNEEIEAMVNISVTYGAKGMLYFDYNAWGSFPTPDYDHIYGRGLADPLGSEPYVTPRLSNAYGQLKWEKIRSINQKLTAWGPTLLSFNNLDRHSYIYRLERDECLYNTYFFDIITYKPGTLPGPCADNNPLPGQNPPSGLVFECYEDRYLQVATFKQSLPSESYPHFMIVNRRCSPVKTGYPDGRRDVRVIFDASHADLYGYDNWKIINVYDNSFVDSFNKTILKLVDLGWFEPGEGKLYRLEPIMKTGGILQGDDTIPSGENFTCEDTVWTNGYNLTIEDGVTIHFTDTSRFIVHGGTFQMGNAQHSGPIQLIWMRKKQSHN
jgi:hypothetical protein